MMDHGLVLGAYALFSGVPDEELVEAYRALEAQPLVGALEMPLAEALGERDCLGEPRNGLPGIVADRWDVVITCIPTVMGRLGSDPRYGLASEDAEGRRAAVGDVRRALELARRTAEVSGRQRIRAIEIHSAPRHPLGSMSAFEASLTELLEIEAGGTALVVEHCDATRPGFAPEKGFLELSEELEVLRSISDDRLGLSINWGRSAIEGRSARTPVEHVACAAREGLLKGIMFSGASDVEGPWGAPWSDGHIAPRGAGPDPTAWSDSLLGSDEIQETLAAADGAALGYLGVKVTVAPAASTVAERLIVADRTLALVALIDEQVRGTALS
ncbi:MAG: DUF4862 family protein [Propionibacteriaceae bacterium]|nr:DUF4862 family protein [Propionibacteriaceae bacterium]